MNSKKEWFGEWFDSPYYHILYKHRDHEEAAQFIDGLIQYFKFTPDHHILDLACGKGRHSIHLNSKGYQVTGADLSEANIQHAQTFSNDRLSFVQHDMRNVLQADTFDFVLNMFTSFGYFENEAENLMAIKAAAANLKVGGRLMIDFLNPYTVINNLVKTELKEVDGITFKINRSFTDDAFIVKEIAFETEGKAYRYQEKVKAIRRLEFLDYFRQAGLRLVDIFGDYQLNPYLAEESDRMIFICEK